MVIRNLEVTLEITKTLRVLLIAAAVVFAGWLVKDIFGSKEPTDYQKNLADWKAQVARVNHVNDSLRKIDSIHVAFGDSVTLLANHRDTVITQLNDQVITVKVKLDKKIEELTADKSECNTLCQGWRETAIAYKAVSDKQLLIIHEDSLRNDERVQAYARLGLAYHDLKLQNDSLTNLIAKVPTYKEEKFLGFIPLPSRKAAFGFGAASILIVEGFLYVLSQKP